MLDSVKMFKLPWKPVPDHRSPSALSVSSPQSTLRISPPLPYLASNVQKDLLRLSSRLDPQDSSSPLTPPSSTSSASSALSRRWRAGYPWPGADALDPSDDTFSIEREARLHRQAAGTRTTREAFEEGRPDPV